MILFMKENVVCGQHTQPEDFEIAYEAEVNYVTISITRSLMPHVTDQINQVEQALNHITDLELGKLGE